MNRRNLLKTFLAAPAIIRSGLLMPVVPLAVPPLRWSESELLGMVETSQRMLTLQADRVWVQEPGGRILYDTGVIKVWSAALAHDIESGERRAANFRRFLEAIK